MLEYAANASALHKAFGDMLLEAGLGGLAIQQEVAVKDLCPTYDNGRDRFDYYLPSFNLVVELHGEQHFKPVNFGGISDNAAKNAYVNRVKVDEKKRKAARDAGYVYVSFRYDEPMTMGILMERLSADKAAQELARAKEAEVTEAIVQMTQAAEQYDDTSKDDHNKANREYYKKLREQNKEKDKAWRRKMYEQGKRRGS